MKKSKAIKLVLVTGLLGAGNSTIARPVNNHLPSKSNNEKRYSTPISMSMDSSQRSFGFSSFVQHLSVHRGGWGFFGHHASS